MCIERPALQLAQTLQNLTLAGNSEPAGLSWVAEVSVWSRKDSETLVSA